MQILDNFEEIDMESDKQYPNNSYELKFRYPNTSSIINSADITWGGFVLRKGIRDPDFQQLYVIFPAWR